MSETQTETWTEKAEKMYEEELELMITEVSTITNASQMVEKFRELHQYANLAEFKQERKQKIVSALQQSIRPEPTTLKGHTDRLVLVTLLRMFTKEQSEPPDQRPYIKQALQYFKQQWEATPVEQRSMATYNEMMRRLYGLIRFVEPKNDDLLKRSLEQLQGIATQMHEQHGDTYDQYIEDTIKELRGPGLDKSLKVEQEIRDLLRADLTPQAAREEFAKFGKDLRVTKTHSMRVLADTKELSSEIHDRMLSELSMTLEGADAPTKRRLEAVRDQLKIEGGAVYFTLPTPEGRVTSLRIVPTSSEQFVGLTCLDADEFHLARSMKSLDEVIHYLLSGKGNEYARQMLSEEQRITTVIDQVKNVMDIDERGNATYTSPKDGTRWKFEQLIAIGTNIVVVRCLDEDKKDMLVGVEKDKLLEAILQRNDRDQVEVALEPLLDTARQRFREEREQSDKLRNYELPPENFAYIPVFPKSTPDTIVARELQRSYMIGHALQSRYKDRAKVQPPLFTDDPEKDLAPLMKSLKKQGITSFYIDVFSHGSPETMESFRSSFSAQGLVNVLDQPELQECSVHLSTIACYGGGLRKDLEAIFDERPELKDRINVAMQTKGDVPNISESATEVVKIGNEEIEVKGGGAASVALLLKGLYDTEEFETLGSILQFIDREAKILMGVDAEAHLNGDWFSLLDRTETDQEEIV